MIDTFIIVIPLMLSPGPANLVSFFLGTRNSITQLLPFQMGILLVYTTVAIALGFLAKRIADFSPHAIGTLQIIGGLFIIYLGIRLIQRQKCDESVRSPTFLSGVTLQCLNPKFPSVVLTVFANRHGQAIMITASIICIVGAIGLLTYSTAGSLLRFQQTDKYIGMVDAIAGILLCGVGLWFLLST